MLRTSREYTRAGDSLISESALWYARGVSAPSGAELVPPSPPTQRERVRGGVSGGVKYIVLQIGKGGPQRLLAVRAAAPGLVGVIVAPLFLA